MDSVDPAPLTLRHRAALAAAAVGLLASWWVAVQRPLPGWERSVTLALNGDGGLAPSVVWLPMQFGTLGASVVVAVAVGWYRRDATLAAVTFGAGLAAWFGAKAVKAQVERGRPLIYLEAVVVHDGSGDGFGYVSGHSAVSAALAVMVAAALPARWRPLPFLVAGVVGVARIVHGVHLPADVIGGWSLGVLIGLAALALLSLRGDRLRGTRTDAGS